MCVMRLFGLSAAYRWCRGRRYYNYGPHRPLCGLQVVLDWFVSARRFTSKADSCTAADAKALSATDSWLWSQYLLIYHRLEAARDEQWQIKMIDSVNQLKHDTTPDLSPSLLSTTSSDDNTFGVLPPLSLGAAATHISTGEPPLDKALVGGPLRQVTIVD
jgi:hypothetical protein